MPASISIDRRAVVDFCRRRRISKLDLFGSVLRDDFGPDSDVDVLVEVEPGAVVGYMDMVDMQFELSDILGRKVDLRTPPELSRYFRDEVLGAAETLYAHR